MAKKLGRIRLHALSASDVWHAQTALTLYAVEPRSIVTVAVNVSGLCSGDVAGLALFNRPYAWFGVQCVNAALSLARFDEQSGSTTRIPLRSRRVWLRAECDFVRNDVGFSYSTDGRGYAEVGEAHAIDDGPAIAHAVRCSLFACSTRVQAEGGHADFDSFVVTTERPVDLHARDEAPEGWR